MLEYGLLKVFARIAQNVTDKQRRKLFELMNEERNTMTTIHCHRSPILEAEKFNIFFKVDSRQRLVLKRNAKSSVISSLQRLPASNKKCFCILLLGKSKMFSPVTIFENPSICCGLWICIFTFQTFEAFFIGLRQ